MSNAHDQRPDRPGPASLNLDRRDRASNSDIIGRLWRGYIRPYWRWLILAVVLMALEGAALGAFAWMVEPMFDTLTGESSMQGVTFVALGVGGLFLFRALAGFGQRMIIAGVGMRIIATLQSHLLQHLLTLDTVVFQHNPPGALIERIRGDTQQLQSAVSSALLTVGRDMTALVALFTVMITTDWMWTLLTLVGLPLLFFPMRFVHRLIKSTARKSRAVSARLTTRLDETLHGIQTIKLNRLEAHERGRFRNELDDYLKFALRSRAGAAANPALIDTLAAIGFAALLYAGGQSIIAGDRTVGEFMSFFTALGLMFEPMRRLASIAGQLQAASASAERVFTLLDLHPTITSPAMPKPLADGDIVFDNVVLGYDSTPVLRGLSFTAAAGKTTALVGASGAGKTTVFAALTRLVDATEGRITIGGVSVSDADIPTLRDTIAVVGQETALFDETIAANIRMGALDASGDDIARAAQDAEVKEFAQSLPHGLDTPVGPRGSGLSGGQRQRVAIARAMLKAAPILLLDEPTSALDARSEKLVGAALDRLAEGRTTLVIAHRLSTIRNADQIIVMDHGRVVEQGTHDNLLAKGGAYAHLHAMQITGQANEP
ncbi:ABC transporter ATP-binding protein [Gymnodinialimonas ulvae]|uniref:ABC transporter ATP-binding protein n=1 Tax=Gymnodinialimonas ulvae TaxID=3126504 RepID=UPI0030ABC2E6